ncbi:hypothetical protein Q31b_37760 [Novipirellula aureliae]|uniref:Uncharacterized protein n=1 Tax=Novipirellula aureliae TaxID=2527966 RepID=A0A5C6DPN5_9BACT|nr:hypothetical protein Q31b_37760 [Novipirellula aureliae]
MHSKIHHAYAARETAPVKQRCTAETTHRPVATYGLRRLAVSRDWSFHCDFDSGIKLNKLRRHLVGEPNAVGGQVERVAGSVHSTSGNGEDDWFTAPLADFCGGLFVRRQMHMMPRSFQQPLFADAY